ncbi:MAG: serine/threonine-protein kinase [Coriobacteriia bacterium]|nr:serine/threonine-protein kinase [Coriobacteriia bacterium]
MESVLHDSPAERTELVRNQDGALLVRKTIAQDSGLGHAYQLLLKRQPTNPAAQPTCIPRIHQCLSTGESLLVLMEYVPGQTLDAVLPAPGAARIARTRELFPRICRAVEMLHRWGIIHRDLKPGNIVVNGDRVALIDFGIARTPKTDARADTTRFGTSGFAPPEQYGFGQTDQRSDVYALGIVLGFCLTGATPDQLPAGQLYESLRGQDRTLDPFLSVIRLATRPDPDQRFGTVADLRWAFREAAAELDAQTSIAPGPGRANLGALLHQTPGKKKTKADSKALSILRNVITIALLVFFAAVMVDCALTPDEGIANQPFPVLIALYGAMYAAIFVPASLLPADLKPFQQRFPALGKFTFVRRLIAVVAGSALWFALAVLVLSIFGN